MATNRSVKPVREQAVKTAAVASDLLREERREKRELAARLRDLEARTGVGAGVGVVNGIAREQVNGFVDFLREQSVVGLAVGLVLGTQLKSLVDSIVNNFISPLIGLLLPGEQTLADKAFVVHAFGKTSEAFGWGKVVLTFISFVAVAALVYALFKLLRLDRLAKKKEEPATKDEKSGKSKKSMAGKKAKK